MLSAASSRLGFALPDSQKVAFNAFMDLSPRLATVLVEQHLERFGREVMARVADFLDDAIAESAIEKRGVIRGFFTRLLKRHSLRVATLNYDDAIERSMQFWDGFTPEDPGSLDYASFEKAHVRELLHLHGSIRFAPSPPEVVPKGLPELVRYQSNKAAAPFRPLPLMQNTFTQAGERVFVGPMLSGLRKTDKLMIEPYNLYHHRFVSGLLSSPRFLCIGYGGADIYVNAAVAQARRIHGDRFRAVYVTKVDEDSSPSDLATLRALTMAAAHSITYAHELDGFLRRLKAAKLCLEENGMLLITSGFPLPDPLGDRVAAFLQ